MSKINMEFSHSLSQNKARKRIMKICDQLKKEFANNISDLHEEWKGNTGKFDFVLNYFRVYVTLTLKKEEVKLSIENPPFEMNFSEVRERVMSAIERQTERLLAKDLL